MPEGEAGAGFGDERALGAHQDPRLGHGHGQALGGIAERAVRGRPLAHLGLDGPLHRPKGGELEPEAAQRVEGQDADADADTQAGRGFADQQADDGQEGGDQDRGGDHPDQEPDPLQVGSHVRGHREQAQQGQHAERGHDQDELACDLAALKEGQAQHGLDEGDREDGAGPDLAGQPALEHRDAEDGEQGRRHEDEAGRADAPLLGPGGDGDRPAARRVDPGSWLRARHRISPLGAASWEGRVRRRASIR
jgi:hypothetical protein